MASNVEIPIDINEKIVHEVAVLRDQSVRVDTLKALSLACREFRYLSLPHLYHSVNIPVFDSYSDSKTGHKSLSALHSILSRAVSRIPQYIRRLRLDFAYDGPGIGDVSSIDPLLGDILSQMQHVTHLDFGAALRNYMIYRWDGLPRFLQRALVKMISSPDLVYFKIQNGRYIPSDVADLIVSVPIVVLENVTFEEYDANASEDVIVPHNSERALRNLTISRIKHEETMPLLDTMRRRHIHLEEVTFSNIHDATFTFSILSQHANHITKLTYHGPPNIFTIKLPRLRIIKLDHPIAYFGSLGITDNIIPFLDTISTSSSDVEVVQLELTYGSQELLLNSRCWLSEEWNILDGLLSTKFDRLKKLEVSACVRVKGSGKRVYEDKVFEYLMDVVPRVLPILHGMGRLDVGRGFE